MTVASKEREILVDIAKGVAILCVVAGHSGFPLTLWINPYSFHMAFFFMIAGFFIKTDAGFIKFVSQKFSRLIIPFYAYFLSFAIISLLLSKYVPCSGIVSPKNFLSINVLLMDPFNRNSSFSLIHPLWFLTTLFGGMVLFALLQRIFSSVSPKIHWLGKILLLIIIGQGVVETQSMFSTVALLQVLARWIIVACFLGIGSVGWKEQERWNNSTVIFVATYIFLMISWRFSPNYIIAQHVYGRGMVKHVFMLCSVLGAISALGICKALKAIPRVSAFLSFCGKQSFTIMALHMSAFELVTLTERAVMPRKIFVRLSDMTSNSWMQRTLLFIAGIIFPLAAVLLVDRLRLIKKRKN